MAERQKDREVDEKTIEMQIMSIYEIIWGTKLLDHDDTKRYTKFQCLALVTRLVRMSEKDNQQMSSVVDRLVMTARGAKAFRANLLMWTGSVIRFQQVFTGFQHLMGPVNSMDFRN